ncbi:mannose-1-phosphate guanylyltransferase [Lachnotalea glycerini]|uniref:Mannose-1-phosphate guanylyltransferase n=1 Tax=Lachnotalea glycerini TaxID=1763509 RepID=A0A318EYC3_9FIRM|nr:mannose-1-phosphate guanylyltransferase [Lachnotalea glycerini]PXV96044.1 mannose-1-phosphate guanylyltransferase [Lachnotalea glycerini]
MDRYIVIMAGGVGSRFWPLSREKKPKQFIRVDGDQCMLVQTIERVCNVVSSENCFIVTNKDLLRITQDTIKDIMPIENIIEEPSRKNTAACIAYSTLLLKNKFGSGILSFIPADGYIEDNVNYVKALEKAYLAAKSTKNLITIGIRPTYPATGYGYIQCDRSKGNESYFKVKKFVEKPDLETAKKLCSSNDYLWNSGIVLGDMDTLINHFKQLLPNHYNLLSEAINQDMQGFSCTNAIEKAYQEVENISFDVSVLEKTSQIYTVRGEFDWDDMGSMEALSKTLKTDLKGNFIKGNYCGVDTSGCVIYSEENILVTSIGIDNMVIACTKDAIVVCPRDRVQEMKELVNELKNKGYDNFI